MVKIIKLHTVKGEARIDSRIIAKELGNQPETVIRLVDEYQRDFEEFGVVRFQTQKLRTSDFSDLKSGKSQGKAKRGRPERYALLNEDQQFPPPYKSMTYKQGTEPKSTRPRRGLTDG
jgi:hypothetical protein